MNQGLTQCLIFAPKYYFLARLTDVPRRINPQTDVPLDQNSLALRARCGVVDDSVVPFMVLVSGSVKGASSSNTVLDCRPKILFSS